MQYTTEELKSALKSQRSAYEAAYAIFDSIQTHTYNNPIMSLFGLIKEHLDRCQALLDGPGPHAQYAAAAFVGNNLMPITDTRAIYIGEKLAAIYKQNLSPLAAHIITSVSGLAQMTYSFSLREFHTKDIIDEHIKRKQLASKMLCTYCSNPHKSLPTCAHPDRHEGKDWEQLMLTKGPDITV